MRQSGLQRAQDFESGVGGSHVEMANGLPVQKTKFMAPEPPEQGALHVDSMSHKRTGGKNKAHDS